MSNFTKFDKPTDSIKLKVLTGDTGGGGAIQSLIGEVKKLHVMSQDSAFGNCLLHTWTQETVGKCKYFCFREAGDWTKNVLAVTLPLDIV